MKNGRLKLASLVVAMLLAVFVNYSVTPTEFGNSVVQLMVPLEIRNVPDDKSVIWPTSRQVELTIQGSSIFLSEVALSRPVVKVTVPEGSSKAFVAKLSAENINLPPTVRLVGIKPSELQFGLDEIVEKSVPVVVPQIGLLSSDLKLDKVTIEPSEIVLRGPMQELKSVQNVETNPVNLTALDRSVVFQEDLRTAWNLVDGSTKNVKVTLEVSEAVGELSLSNIPIMLDVQNAELNSLNPRVTQKGVSVSLRGSKKVLRNIKKESLVARAVLNSGSQLADSIELQLNPLEGVEIVTISPRRVAVSFDVTPTATATPKAVNSRANNAGARSNSAKIFKSTK